MKPSSTPIPAPRPLAGASVVVTRPAGDADAFIRRARALGAQALRLPGTALRSLPAPASPRPACDLWIFTSPAAVRHAFAGGLLVDGAPAFAVGAGTRRALARHGIAATAPSARADSEGLLALPQLAEVGGRRIALVGAPGGRGVIAAQLQRRGADIVPLHVYQRMPPRWTHRQLEALGAAPEPLLTLLSSGEALANLAQRLAPPLFARLRRGCLVVSSDRLAGLAAAAGFAEVVVAASAAGRDLFDAAVAVRHR
jgi:uroporphyrinogen-III synthase